MPLIPLLCIAFSQSHIASPPTFLAWEKRLAPGLVYRMEWNPKLPRIVDALRVSLGAKAIHATTELAGGTVFEAGPAKGCDTVSHMVQANGAIAGINGDFFPYTGDPLGLMVREGELVSAPYQTTLDPAARRAALGWGDGVSALGLSDMTLTIVPETGGVIAAEGLDEDGGPDRVTVDFPAVGLALAKAPNAFVILNVPDARLTPNTDITGTVQAVGADLTSRAVEPGTVLLLATGKAAAKFVGIQAGETVKIHERVTGFDFTRVKNVIGGGPILLKDGKVVIDYALERFKKAFAEDRHPRTIIGRTKSGDLWLVAIDGRSAISVGATLLEAAHIMQRLGCVDAVNLDGGASTTFDLFGTTVNRPSDGVERPVACSVLIKAKRVEPTKDALFLSRLPAGARPNAANHLSVLEGGPESKRRVANTEVIWTCSGAAWIDQGGNLHPRSTGVAHVVALTRGLTLSADYKVVADTKATPGAIPD
ncbi:MAG: phosphodiester glycosidase family protein [Fimbriimonadaceae bacterium]